MKLCKVNNCTNPSEGRICSTHRYRLKIHGHYDPKGYTGTPSFIEEYIIPSGFVKFCEKHGNLKEGEIYNRLYKGKVSSKYCKICTKEANMKRIYKSVPDMEKFQELIDEQNNRCAICQQPETTYASNKKEIRRMSVDHCHKTGKVRGLLCASCNKALGCFKDSIKLIDCAASYLKYHQNK